jgi:hypothetical protein
MKTCGQESTVGSHVVPISDMREHETSRTCWCHPTLDDDEDALVWVHHSLDGREKHEGDYGAPLH